MPEPTLQDIFGTGATQDATTITLLKSDFDMTAAAVNRGEQVFSAIVKKAAATLTSTNFSTNPDQSINLAPGFDSIIYRTIDNAQLPYLQTQLTVNFAKAQSSSGITPNDY